MPVVRDPQRPLGVVYTPVTVARSMVRVALQPLLAGKTADEILALRICDPAIGEGAFVAEIVEQLTAAAGGSSDVRRAIAAQCIAGVDVDPRAVEAARRATGVANLRTADALALDWPAAFPHVFARGGFDAVVGNPPYVRQEWLGGKANLRGFASYDGVADLYVYFVELAHRLARTGGRYCLITPNKWLTVDYGRPLRRFLAEQRSVAGLADLGALPLFADADAFPCILWGTVGGVAGDVAAARIAESSDDVLAAAIAAAHPQPRERWTAEPWHVDDPADRALIDRLAARWPSLADVVPTRPARGVVTGCNRAFVVDRATRDAIIARSPAAAELLRPFVKGRDVRRWRVADADRWIALVDHGASLGDTPALAEHLAQFRSALEPRPPTFQGPWHGRKPGRYRWYELQDPVGPLVATRTPRLLYQDIQTEPACALEATGEVVPDTTVWMLPTQDRVILAILNSSIYRWYARRRFPPALNGAVRPKLAYIRTLPLAQPSPDLRAQIERLVANQLAGDDVDEAIDAHVLDAYELTRSERARVTR